MHDEDEVKLPEEHVEDLEPTGEDADEVTGGIHRVPGKYKAGNITVTRATEEP